MSREDRFQIMLRSDIKKEFMEQADKMGLPASTLAASIIGQWLMAQKAVTNMLSGPQIADVVTKAIRAESKADNAGASDSDAVP